MKSKPLAAVLSALKQLGCNVEDVSDYGVEIHRDGGFGGIAVLNRWEPIPGREIERILADLDIKPSDFARAVSAIEKQSRAPH